MLFQWQVLNALFALRWPSTSFQTRVAQAPIANRHINMSCFGDGPALVSTRCPTLVSTSQKLHATKHEPQNLILTETCQVLMGNSMHISMLEQPKPLKHIPPKHETFQELCFDPICPSSMFPHVIPIHAPWPIHDVLDLFNFPMLHLTFVGLLYQDH